MPRHYNTTPESRAKMSKQRKGRVPWNKGLTADTNEKVKEISEKTSTSLKKSYKEGRIKNWNNGIKIDREKYPNMGHFSKHSDESIKKMKTARKGKSAHWNKGEKSPMWKGGISGEQKTARKGFEFRAWREAVFERDNWTCQKSKIRGGKLHPHHILNFSDNVELRFDVSNGITLSEEEHKNFHKKYGSQNNTLAQITEFINS